MRLPLIGAALAAMVALAAEAAPDPRSELARSRAAAEAARDRSIQLSAQARSAGDAADRARLAQAAAAAQVQAAEADIAAAEARIAVIEARLRAQQQQLAARQQPVVRLLAAVQTMARRPAAAALAQPGSIRDLVHLRAMLGTVTPEVQRQTTELRAELDRRQRLRAGAARALAERADGKRRATILHRELARLVTEQRQRSQSLAGAARMEAERATTIAASSRGLSDLVGSLDRDARQRDRLASLPGPLPRPSRLDVGLPNDLSAAENMTLSYRLPVVGRIVRGYGEPLPSGMRAQGITISARPGALIVAPAAGRTTFAGLFRGYGVIAILDHGGGYTSLLTGLAATRLRVGDTLAQGSPVGSAGSAAIAVELRKDGSAVDVSQFVG